MLVVVLVLNCLIIIFLALFLFFSFRFFDRMSKDIRNEVIDSKARVIIAINKLIKRSDIEVPKAEMLDDETLFMREVAERARNAKEKMRG